MRGTSGIARAVVGSLGLAAVVACSHRRPLPTSDGDGRGVAPTEAQAAVPAGDTRVGTWTAVSDSTPAHDPPPYDLAADLAARNAEARAQLGETAATDVVSDVFLFASARRDASYEGALKLARQALDAYFNRRFGHRPERAVTVTVFPSDAAFHTFCKDRLDDAHANDLGVYDRRRREILVDAAPGLGTLTHELVHPIVQSDFPDAPAWLNEGLGALFEAPAFPRPGEVHGTRNWRLARLRAASSSPTERDAVRLESLFGMSDATFLGEDRDLHYAMARYAFQWLDERGALWAFYAAWRDARIDDVTGEAAFARATGMTPREASEEWRRWVLR